MDHSSNKYHILRGCALSELEAERRQRQINSIKRGIKFRRLFRLKSIGAYLFVVTIAYSMVIAATAFCPVFN